MEAAFGTTIQDNLVSASVQEAPQWQKWLRTLAIQGFFYGLAVAISSAAGVQFGTAVAIIGVSAGIASIVDLYLRNPHASPEDAVKAFAFGFMIRVGIVGGQVGYILWQLRRIPVRP